MDGPDMFDRHIDMAERRSSINALLGVEKWRPLDAPPEAERRWLTLKSKRFRRLLCILTLNGHLVPFSRLMWDRVTVPIENRSSAHESFGAARVSYINADGTMGYRVEQSKWQFLLIALQTLLVMAQFTAGFGRLRRAYREGYSLMATKSYWQDKAGACQSAGRISTL
jgi:hypothetical protein